MERLKDYPVLEDCPKVKDGTLGKFTAYFLLTSEDKKAFGALAGINHRACNCIQRCSDSNYTRCKIFKGVIK